MSRTTRRTFLSTAALGGATVGLASALGSGDDAEVREIELDGETSGWVGRRPTDIEGEINPTLPLAAGQTYAVSWVNADGVPHNFAIEDADGSAVVESEIIREEGATQTVEFTASEAMAEYVCQVHPDSMRGDLSLTSETPEETSEETTSEPGQPEFERSIIEDNRGDVASFALSLGGADRAEVVVGSEAVNYAVSFTAIDGDGDGEVTVTLDTSVAGQGNGSGIGTLADGDEIREYRQRTPTLSSPLDAAVYPLEAHVDDRVTAEALLVLEPRRTEAAHAGVAPRSARPSNPADFRDRVSRRGEVATADWAVLEVEASGLYATLDGVEAFEDESLGYELTIEQTDAFNRAPDTVPLEDVALVTDPENDRFFAVVDSATLEDEASYEATFSITDANPYVPEGERESVSAEFSVVERTATFDTDESGLRVPPAEVALSGTTTVAPGTRISISAFGTGENPFQKGVQTTVDEDGSWTASLDFSDLEPETPFFVEVLDLSDAVRGLVESAE